MEEKDKDVLVEIDGLIVNFYTYQGIVQAIEGVDLTIRKGETLGLVGETGCGKSVTASSIMKLILSPPGKIEEGSVYFMEPPQVRAKRLEYSRKAQEWYNRLTPSDKQKLVARFGTRFTGFKKRVKAMKKAELVKATIPDKVPRKAMASYLRDQAAKLPKADKETREALLSNYDLLAKSDRYMQRIRGKFISMIFQEPTSALNPVFTAGDQIAEVILLHRKAEMATRVLKRLEHEESILKKSTADWEKEAKEWYQKLPDRGRREAIIASGPRPFFRGLPVTSEDQLQTVVVPDQIPARTLGWYVASKKRPMKLRSPEVEEAEISGRPAHEHEPFTCSMCGSEVKETDLRCYACEMEHYTWLQWRLRPLVLPTYKRIMRSIIKNPDAKQGILSRVPILRRYTKELEKEALNEAVNMLEIVRIPDPSGIATRYPYELSGGMQQRVMIAIALSCNPRLLIADEPTTALDVTIQGQILKLMRDLKARFGSSILLITHNLGVVAEMCDRIGVMYAGSMAEIGAARDIFKNPVHPYTMGLMKSVPSIQMEAERLYTIRGSVPNLIYPPSGCRFHPRCDFSRAYCTKVRPPLTEITPGHFAACHMAAKAEGYVHG